MELEKKESSEKISTYDLLTSDQGDSMEKEAKSLYVQA